MYHLDIVVIVDYECIQEKVYEMCMEFRSVVGILYDRSRLSTLCLPKFLRDTDRVMVYRKLTVSMEKSSPPDRDLQVRELVS